jgi:hypothetical protein
MVTQDFILGQYFRDIADATYAPMPKSPNAWEEGDYDNLPNTFDVKKVMAVKHRPFIVYTHTMYAHLLLPILADINHEFVLVTHNSDCFIADEGIGFKDGRGTHWKTELATISPNVILWYSPNVNTLNPLIQGIPTGLANEWWSPEVKKRDKMCDKWYESRIIRNLVYMDHNFVQNPLERKLPYDVLGDKPWVTAQMGGLNFIKFLDNVYNHKFVICPRGNGMGTHREWETLYMGSIPIMERDLNNRFYEGKLPFCFVNKWDDIDEEFLNQEYDRIKNTTWKMEMLTFAYWKNKILNTR